MLNWNHFERSVFTLEEQERIQIAVDRGDTAHLAQIITLDDPKKEYWVGKIIETYAPPIAKIDMSETKALLDEVEREKGGLTPEIEAELQAKIDEKKAKEEERIAPKKAKGKKAKEEAINETE